MASTDPASNAAAPQSPVAGADATDGNNADGGPMSFSNANLVKFNTFDEFSSMQQAKKNIGKAIPPLPNAGSGTPEAVSSALRGLIRAGKNPSTPYLFLAFDTEENKDAAVAAILATCKTRSKPWELCELTERDLQVTHKKGKQTREHAKVDSSLEGPSVASWMRVPYADQIGRKADYCRSILKTINKYSAIRDGTLRTGEMLSDVLRSPMLSGYRNNVQLSCGFGEDGVTPLVGFQAGQSVDGVCAIVPADGIPTVHPVALAVASSFMTQLYQRFAAPPPTTSSSDAALAEEDATLPLTMYSKKAHRGFWRKLHIRHNKEAEVMVDIEVNPAGVSAARLDAVRRGAQEWGRGFAASVPPVEWAGSTTAPQPPPTSFDMLKATIVSLQWHFYEGQSTAPIDVEREVLHGGATLTQTLFGLHFDISPGAFFQINRPGTEELLSRVVTEAQLSSDRTILLDLCCGTGTIGLCLSKYVQRVIGVEMVAAAVENAMVNAKRNGVENATFVCGKVEHALKGVLDGIKADVSGDKAAFENLDIVAILDPPRSGVHRDVLKWLRNCSAVRRIVYISCDQRALETDCEPLCKAGTHRFGGYPFRVCGSYGVDLFPHTPHVEMVVTMRRTTEEELNAIAAGKIVDASGEIREAPPRRPREDAPESIAAGPEDAQPTKPQPSAEQTTMSSA